MSRRPDTFYFTDAVNSMRMLTNRELRELERRLDADLPIGLLSRRKLQEIEGRWMRWNRDGKHDASEFRATLTNELRKRREREGWQ